MPINCDDPGDPEFECHECGEKTHDDGYMYYVEKDESETLGDTILCPKCWDLAVECKEIIPIPDCPCSACNDLPPGYSSQNGCNEEKKEIIPNEIVAYLHCKKCLEELPADQTPKEWSRTQAGFTDKGIQIWCNRHNKNIMHMDFEGVKHPTS